MPAKPTTIAEYIASAPAESKPKLREIYKLIATVVPGATQGLKWGMPAFSYARILVTFAGFKHHIGLYPTPSAIMAFKKELVGYTTAAGSVQFPLDKPLPVALIKKIVAFRVKESKQDDAKWRS